MDQFLKDTLIRNKPPIPESLRKIIVKHGVPTGSFKFGGYDPETSDIDVIFPPGIKDPSGIEISVNSLSAYVVYVFGDYDETEFQSCYVKTEDGTILNLLIFYELGYFNIWKKSTKLMCKITSIKYIRRICENKHKRINLFEALKSLHSFIHDGNDPYKDDVSF